MRKLFCLLTAIFALSSAYAQVKPICGPYIQNPTTTGFTVVWETNMDAVAWVEVAPDDGTHFYNCERPKYYDLRGYGNQVISNIHKIRIDGLQPGTKYRYRIMMKGVLSFEGPGKVEYTRPWGSDVYKGVPYEAFTLRKDYDKLRFDMYTDIHQKDSILNVLMKGAKKDEVDFVVFNGDMVSSLAWKEKIRDTYLATGARNLDGRIPLYNIRGNHEMRGTDTRHWFDYVDMPQGKPYFTASYGKFLFIFLDCLEDKPDSDMEYSGTMLSDPYLQEQADWLKEVTGSKEFKNAAVRIVIGHIPPMKDGWHGDLNMEKYFVPILNKAKIDLWLAGHHHKWRVDEPGTVSSANFPVVINKNCERMEVCISAGGINIETFSPEGVKTHEYSRKVSR